MAFQIQKILENFYTIGINHYRTDVSVRELFALNTENQQKLLDDAKSLGIESLIILSTCNRTEIYTQTDNIELVKKLLIKYSKGSLELLEQYGYIFSNEEAIKHLYKVGAGLDSQILGDFQIIGQLKDAYRIAEQKGMVNTLLNRIFAHIFQASKKVKNQTQLSNGTASVAHAAVQYIKENIADLKTCNFLLFGTGEIGKITCDNLVRHLQKKHALTLINRSEDKAITLAEKYQVTHKKVENLGTEIEKADVIIVATGANTPTVTKEHFQNHSRKSLILDLSVPRNVAPEVAELPNTQLIDVDKLSKVSNETLKIREESIPQAEQIIEENYTELQEWLEIQQLSPIFSGLQKGLARLKEEELAYHRTKLTDEEYEKAELIATNIVNRIGRIGIMHIKEVFKSNESSNEILSKMFKQYSK
ncbi:MAG: glutamyl-tRNA reductase [Flavobacteriaceae bacterium]|nr:glutamyl-tRNA reductase [Flavobacteriaceae bacterium]